MTRLRLADCRLVDGDDGRTRNCDASTLAVCDDEADMTCYVRAPGGPWHSLATDVAQYEGTAEVTTRGSLQVKAFRQALDTPETAPLRSQLCSSSTS